jgi:hypothetical protein
MMQSLDRLPLFPGWTGYCGWNYECAVAIHAYLLDDYMNLSVYHNRRNETTGGDVDIAPKIRRFLQAGTIFPQPGSRIQAAPFFQIPGDRIGLFGALYFNYTVSDNKLTQRKVDNIVDVVEYRLLNWNKFKGVFIRPFGWKGTFTFSNFWNLFQFSWVWIDDSFMGGYALVFNHPEKLSAILQSYNAVLRDPKDGLWYHGANIKRSDGSVTPNGVKWGRGNGWLLLALSTFLIRTDEKVVQGREEIINILLDQLSNLIQYQRASGAFGNVVNSEVSPDESSLTSVYVFAVGTAVHLKLLPYSSMEVMAAEKAWNWLERRTAIALTVVDTCAAQGLELDSKSYDAKVGRSSGPAVAFILYAALGRRMLDLASSP